jgi:adenylate cyclase
MVDVNNQPQQSTVLGEVRHLKTLLEDISVSLKNQREILKTRNITLPPMTMQSLQSVNADLDKLEKRLVNEQTELGQLRALAENVAMVNSSFDINSVLRNAMDVVITLTGAERGYIILRNPQTQEIEFRVSRENELSQRGGQQNTNGTPQISMSVVRDVLQTGEPLLADNAYKDERLQGMNSIAAFSLRSVLCVPLKYKDNTLGAVYVDNRIRAGVFEQRERNLLAAFANLVSIALENARLYTDIQNAVHEITDIKEVIDNVFESIGSGVITTDSADSIMTFNRAAASILEKERERVIGQRVYSVMRGVSADFDEYLQKVRDLGERQVLDAEFQVNQDERVAVNMKLSPLRDAEKKTQGVAIVLDDITEQRERDEMLSIIARYLPPQLVKNIRSIAEIDLGGERREVTCVYVDVRPFSTIPPGMRPQQIMEMVNVYLATATDCIQQLNGVIDKYMGQEIMCLFNTQLNPLEDHAVRAAEAALLIRDAFVKLYQELGINPNPHYYRIGMNTGVATMGNVGSISRRDFTAIGDTINLSKRLEENATPGQILIGETTYAHLLKSNAGAKIRFSELEPMQVKGRQQTTRVYEIFRL